MNEFLIECSVSLKVFFIVVELTFYISESLKTGIESECNVVRWVSHLLNDQEQEDFGAVKLFLKLTDFLSIVLKSHLFLLIFNLLACNSSDHVTSSFVPACLLSISWRIWVKPLVMLLRVKATRRVPALVQVDLDGAILAIHLHVFFSEGSFLDCKNSLLLLRLKKLILTALLILETALLLELVLCAGLNSWNSWGLGDVHTLRWTLVLNSFERLHDRSHMVLLWLKELKDKVIIHDQALNLLSDFVINFEFLFKKQ